jgi:putative resolvase
MDRAYPPRKFARMVGRTVHTLQRWDREGTLPAKRTSTNQRYYTYEDYLRVLGREPRERHAYAYLRVSSPAQRPDLANQRATVEQFCIAAGKEIEDYLEDVGSGLNYKRKNFLRLMEMVEHGEVSEIVIAHKDRLVRFGFEFFEKFCSDHGCRITVMKAESLSPEEAMPLSLS